MKTSTLSGLNEWLNIVFFRDHFAEDIDPDTETERHGEPPKHGKKMTEFVEKLDNIVLILDACECSVAKYNHKVKFGLLRFTRQSRVRWKSQTSPSGYTVRQCTNEMHSICVLYSLHIDPCHLKFVFT